MLDSFIPRFLWRAESRSSRYRVLESSDWASQHVLYNRVELRSHISDHMKFHNYHAPFVITSLTGSLLWALNYAHWLLNRGEQEVRIVLVDAWSARTDHIYPARYVAACLEIPPLGPPGTMIPTTSTLCLAISRAMPFWVPSSWSRP